jgi:hypothetical protein
MSSETNPFVEAAESLEDVCPKAEVAGFWDAAVVDVTTFLVMCDFIEERHPEHAERLTRARWQVSPAGVREVFRELVAGTLAGTQAYGWLDATALVPRDTLGRARAYARSRAFTALFPCHFTRHFLRSRLREDGLLRRLLRPELGIPYPAPIVHGVT